MPPSLIKKHLLPVPYTALLITLPATLLILLTYFYDNWILSYVSVVAPILILLNVAVCLFLLFKKSLWLIIPVSVILLEYNFVKGIWVVNPTPASHTADVSVLSYNVAAFDQGRFVKLWHPETMKSDTTVPEQQIKYIIGRLEADVLCFQEFYNNDFNNSESTMDKLMMAGWNYYYTNPWIQEDYPGFFGLITFSKYPIFNTGTLIFHDSISLNKGIYTDIALPEDTVRIINIHMKSMSLRLGGLLSSRNDKELKQYFTSTFESMHDGYLKRKDAVNDLYTFIQDSPYPVILSGDLNDLPYSYTYRKLRTLLHNSFEKRGNGFGFTYNHFPYIIRIDNQFFSPDIEAVNFAVDQNNKLSDHYPILGTYRFSKQ